MSKENRLDIAIGILDYTEDAIERIKNQHKFEKDLSEFLNTNTYSKDKHWVAGMLNQVSEYCKDKIDTLMENQQRIAELEEQLKNAIRFKTPPIERFAIVQYVHRKGKPYKIEHCYDTYKDENMNTVYCYYDCDSYNFKVIQICDTKEEAQAKLKELQGEKR